ncbi:MAG: winged helix-turn-helix domain-containing protein [Phycisphaerales bacterium]|nr:winged helix-turn-helix domain-containing protein [Phycisphaerales bacterium]MCB9864329.1 winged helix-turn-helix domain-containing protein [Phycisphaerales bacterium]
MATKKTNKKSGKKRTASARRGTTNTTRSSKMATAAPAVAKQSKSRPANENRPKPVSGLDLAAEVLAESSKPLNAKTIAERVIAAGWRTDGATPHATLYSAIVREITKKGSASRFKKTDRGLFARATSKGGKA